MHKFLFRLLPIIHPSITTAHPPAHTHHTHKSYQWYNLASGFAKEKYFWLIWHKNKFMALLCLKTLLSLRSVSVRVVLTIWKHL